MAAFCFLTHRLCLGVFYAYLYWLTEKNFSALKGKKSMPYIRMDSKDSSVNTLGDLI